MQSLKKFYFGVAKRPYPIIDLHIGETYNTAVQLLFTVPFSKNTIVTYECYLDGIFYQKINASGEFLTGLIKNTSYNNRIVVLVVDNKGKKSKASNLINTSTANIDYSTYSDTAEANAYLSASGISGTNAVNSSKLIIYHLIDKGLWSSIFALYPFKGISSTQQKWNAKNPVDTDTAFRLVFAGSGTYSDDGFQINGVNACADTKFVPLVNVTNINAFGLTLVSGTNNIPTINDCFEIGGTNTVQTGNRIAVRNRGGGSDRYYGAITGSYVVNNVFTPAYGVYTISKKSSSRTVFFKNARIDGINFGTPTNALHNLSIYIGSEHPNGPIGFSNQRIQTTIIHLGLTDGQIIQLHEIINESESLAGRKTW